MGFSLGNIVNKIGGVVTGAIGGGLVGGPVGAALGGFAGFLQSQGMEEAAQQYEKGTEEQRRAMELAYQRQEGLVREGLAVYKSAQERSAKLLEQMYADTGGARRVMQDVAESDPGVLRPTQTRTLDDLSKSFQAHLAGDGLRGSGEMGVAAGFDTLAKSRERMVEGNRTEKMNAADRLATAGYGSVVPAANLAAAGGRTTLDALTGLSTSDARRGLAGIAGDNAITQGNLALAQGNQMTDTLGSIAGLLNLGNKEFDPARRFATSGMRTA